MYWPPFWNKVYEVRKKPRGEKLLSNKQTSARHKKKRKQHTITCSLTKIPPQSSVWTVLRKTAVRGFKVIFNLHILSKLQK